jgi:hypothetical protein
MYSWFLTFAVFWMLYAFFWVIPQHLNSPASEFRCQEITQKKAYNMYSCCLQVGFNWIPWMFAISDLSFSRTKTVRVFAHFSFYIGWKETFMNKKTHNTLWCYWNKYLGQHYFSEAHGERGHVLERVFMLYNMLILLYSYVIIAFPWKDGDEPSMWQWEAKYRIAGVGSIWLEPLVQYWWSQLPTIPFLHWFIKQLVALHNAMNVGLVGGVPGHLQVMCWHRCTNHILWGGTGHWNQKNTTVRLKFNPYPTNVENMVSY